MAGGGGSSTASANEAGNQPCLTDTHTGGVVRPARRPPGPPPPPPPDLLRAAAGLAVEPALPGLRHQHGDGLPLGERQQGAVGSTRLVGRQRPHGSPYAAVREARLGGWSWRGDKGSRNVKETSGRVTNWSHCVGDGLLSGNTNMKPSREKERSDSYKLFLGL